MDDYKKIIAWGALALAVWFFIFKRLLIKDPETQAITMLSTGTAPESKVNKAFDKSYFAKVAKQKGKKPTELLNAYGYNTSMIYSDAMALYDAKGIINDDETLVYNVIASVPNIFCLSALSFTFHYKYKIELLSHLKSFLNEKELAKVFQIINKKKLA